jgi:hypothetical protein
LHYSSPPCRLLRLFRILLVLLLTCIHLLLFSHSRFLIRLLHLLLLICIPLLLPLPLLLPPSPLSSAPPILLLLTCIPLLLLRPLLPFAVSSFVCSSYPPTPGLYSSIPPSTSSPFRRLLLPKPRPLTDAHRRRLSTPRPLSRQTVCRVDRCGPMWQWLTLALDRNTRTPTIPTQALQCKQTPGQYLDGPTFAVTYQSSLHATPPRVAPLINFPIFH